MPMLPKVATLLLFSLITSSCSSTGKSAQLESASREGALTLLIQADPQLNRYQRNAHTLFLCLYQLKDPNGFTQLVQERDGLQKLLECGRFDGSVASARQYVVQPGQRLTEMRDVAEGSRYLAVATGYFGSGKTKVTDLANLSSTQGGAATTVSIELGPDEITGFKVK